MIFMTTAEMIGPYNFWSAFVGHFTDLTDTWLIWLILDCAQLQAGYMQHQLERTVEIVLPLCFRYASVMLPLCLRYAYELRRYKSYVWEPRHVCMAGVRTITRHHRNHANYEVIFDHNLSDNTIRRLGEGCYDTTPNPAKAIPSTPLTSYDY